MIKPIFSAMLSALLDKYGPVLTLPLPYGMTLEAEHAQRWVADLCPDLLIELEICGGEWRLVVSRKEAVKRATFDA